MAAWLSLAGLVCIGPVLHFIPLSISENLGHERFMTTALAFLALAVVFLPWQHLSKVLRVPSVAAVRLVGLLLVGWLVLCCWTIYSVLPFWRSDLQLWNWAYKSYPSMDIARYNYLFGALQEGRSDLVSAAIEKMQKERGGLEVGEQLLYANLLMREGDSESIKYLEGVLFALPKFHLMENGRSYIDNFYLTATQMSSAYADYAMGWLIFKGDPKLALEYNSTALWYLRESQKIPMLYQRAAILYVLGDFVEADALLAEQKGLYYHRAAAMGKMVEQILARYCELDNADKVSCRRLRERGLIKI
jgi:hypothetical protein